MKKTLIALLCVAMMICLAVSASAASEFGTLSANANKTEVMAGEKVEFVVSISGAPTSGYNAIGIQFDYDDSIFECKYNSTTTEPEEGGWLLDGAFMNTYKIPQKQVAQLYAAKVFDPNKDAYKLVLDVKADALPGTYTVSFAGSLGAAANQFDAATVEIKVVCEHVWATEMTKTNATNHWYACTKNGCTAKKDEAPHAFANACDTQCDTCGFTRTTEHQWNADYTTDDAKHWIECKECGEKKDEAAHVGGTATCKDKAVCTTCNKGYGELAAHKAVEVVDAKYLKSEANCVSKAVYYKSCEVCEQALTETFETGEKNAEKHADVEPVFKGAEPATCTVPGKTGDKHCGACDVKLADSEPIEAGHKLTKVEALNADCTNDGNVEYYECSGNCGKLYKDAEAKEAFEKAEDVVVKAAGHKLTKVEKVDSTTAKEGTKEHYKCDVCGKLFEDAEGKKEITDEKTLVIEKKPAGGTPQTGSNVALVVVALVALVGSVATIPAVVGKKR